jgi:uncharacterized OB-fold protein
MTATPQAYVPQPDELDLEFFKATVAAGALCIQRCSACGTWTHPARYYCPSCASPDFSFEKVSGRATVYSYTVSHFSVEAAWKPLVPYVTIVAELEEGPRIVAGASGIAPDEIAIGQTLRIATENKSAEFAFFRAERREGGT